jgi:hypothetical protein
MAACDGAHGIHRAIRTVSAVPPVQVNVDQPGADGIPVGVDALGPLWDRDLRLRAHIENALPLDEHDAIDD